MRSEGLYFNENSTETSWDFFFFGSSSGVVLNLFLHFINFYSIK